MVGEITEYHKPGSGHIYFTLADKAGKVSNARKKSILKCTFFKGNHQNLSFEPKVGDEVQVIGSVSLYYAGGLYNFNVRSLHKMGLGNLFLQIQELRQRLIKEGVIDPTLKKKLPFLPQKIGIVTGMKTAALKDILKQVMERYPHINILIAPALMQGEDSANSIVNALHAIAQKEYQCDVILLSRGGGSAEDLMPFNDERVARAIFECGLPVISGIGHEIDHPIADDVSDKAGATPTDAAKIALPVVSDLLLSLQAVELRMNQRFQGKRELLQEKLNRISQKKAFQEPLSIVQSYQHRIDDVEMRLVNSFQEKIKISSDLFRSLPDIYYLLGRKIHEYERRYTGLEEKLLAFSPLATLKRGYTITYQNGKILRSIEKLNKRNDIQIQFHDGKIDAQIMRV